MISRCAGLGPSQHLSPGTDAGDAYPLDAAMTPCRAPQILVVEDEILLSVALEDMLLDLGMEVSGSAARLDDAVRLAQNGTFDAAILDINLGGIESFPVADWLVARGIPYMFVTGYGQAVMAPAHRLALRLQKPYAVEQIAAGLRTLLKNRALST